MDPRTLRYTKTHEWAHREGDTCTVGITKFAADQLTDVTYLELPPVGQRVVAGLEFGNVETVKAVSPLYSPVDGEVVAVNEELLNDPNRITQDPLGEGWLIRIRLGEEAGLDHLMTLEQYEQQIASEGH